MVFSMVAGNLHIRWAILGPEKADAPLLIYSDRILVGAVAPQAFQAVPWWDTQVGYALRLIQLCQFAKGCFLYIASQSLRPHSLKDFLRFLAGE